VGVPQAQDVSYILPVTHVHPRMPMCHSLHTQTNIVQHMSSNGLLIANSRPKIEPLCVPTLGNRYGVQSCYKLCRA
jgi:hypothetical protein